MGKAKTEDIVIKVKSRDKPRLLEELRELKSGIFGVDISFEGEEEPEEEV